MQDFSGQDLAGKDFSNQDLSGADFTGANLEGANFKGAILKKANFTGATLKGANFSLTNLKKADFTGANLKGATFTYPKLNLTNFSKANLEEATLSVDPCKWSGFIDANLRQASIHGDFYNTDFSGADFSGADCSGANFTDISFERVNFTGTRFLFSRPNFRQAEGAILIGTTQGDTFVGTSINSEFSNVVVKDAITNIQGLFQAIQEGRVSIEKAHDIAKTLQTCAESKDYNPGIKARYKKDAEEITRHLLVIENGQQYIRHRAERALYNASVRGTEENPNLPTLHPEMWQHIVGYVKDNNTLGTLGLVSNTTKELPLHPDKETFVEKVLSQRNESTHSKA